MFSYVKVPHAKRCVAIGTEVDRIVRVHDQTQVIEGEGPAHDFYHMQIEHEEDGPPE